MLALVKPEKVITDISLGKEATEQAFSALQNSIANMRTVVQNTFSLHESIIKQYTLVIRAGNYFDLNKEAYEKYAGANSLQQALDKVYTVPEFRREVLELIDQKVNAWCEINPNYPVGKRMRALLIKHLLNFFNIKDLSHIPCTMASEILEWIKSFSFPIPLKPALCRPS
ncbi:MAG: hypothetical protein K6T65_01385 [Peptococcaceae bacterium]|nr:hypothetical protein [Peptococcaceae bacterium]